MEPDRTAFDDSGRAANASGHPDVPIDRAHLSNQTMGDPELEIEVLQLFAQQARACLAGCAASDSVTVRESAHRLKGAAGAVGAFEVAAAAAALEASPGEAALADAVASAVVRAESFILDLCR